MAKGVPDLLPVAEARQRIVAALTPVTAEFLPLASAHDRVLADFEAAHKQSTQKIQTLERGPPRR